MKKITCITALSLLIAVNAYADHIQCGGGFVSVGDSRSVMIAKCGQPVDHSERDDLSGDYKSFNTKRIEEWTFATGGFLRILTVVNGKIVKIETAGRSN